MIEIVKRERRQTGSAQFKGFPYGENTNVPASMLNAAELSSCIDFDMEPGGRLVTRSPWAKYSDTAVGPIADIKQVSIGGSQKILVSDTDKDLHYLSANTAGTGVTPVQIGTSGCENTPYIMGYNDVATISDGSFLKYCDSTSEIKIAYDAGDDGTQYNNYSGDDDTTISGTRVAAKFTSESWDTGYTIPLTKITAKVQQTTAGTATISAKLRAVSDDSILAEKDYSGDVPSAAAGYIDITFTESDITTEMSPTTDYYASLEGSNFNLQCTTVASGGRAYTYSGSWAEDITKDPIMKVYPGVPPKSEFVRISKRRPWLKDPDAPGKLKFGNYTHLDWSTDNGGGSIGVVDDNKDSFEIGAMEDFLGGLVLYGTQGNPYLCQLTGDTPEDFAVTQLFQQVWATPRTLINAGNDLWYASADGAGNLIGVEEYGDLRTNRVSDPIADRFENWTSSAIAGYRPNKGQYLLYMPGYDYVSICHTKQGIEDESGKTRYPWVRHDLPFTPTCFCQTSDGFLAGGSDGFIYRLDADEYKDLETTQIYPTFATPYIELPQTIDLTRFQLLARSVNGSSMTMKIFVNGLSGTPVLTKTIAMPMSDVTTIEDLFGVAIEDLADVAIYPDGTPLYFDININCYSFMIEISSVHIAGEPVYFDGCNISYAVLEV